MSENSSSVRQALARAHSAVKMLLGRGRVQLIKDNDTGPVQTMQVVVSAKETMDMPRLAEFGFTSRPPKDSDCAVMFISGERTWGVVIATGNQKFRLQLEEDGEAALYDAFGKSIWLKKDGIVIDGGDKPITINRAKGIAITSTDDVTVDMGGKNLIVTNPGAVNLTGAGGRKVVCDGDPVSGGVVHAAAGQKVTAT